MKNSPLFYLVLIFALGLSFFLNFPAFSQAPETITISTYYPAPYGVFQEIRLFPTPDQPPANNPPLCTIDEEGTIYYSNNRQQVLVCGRDANGNLSWQGIGLWTRDLNNNNNVALVNNNWDVGVGMVTPGTYDNQAVKLDVSDFSATKDVYLKDPKNGNPRWASEGCRVQTAMGIRGKSRGFTQVQGPAGAVRPIDDQKPHPATGFTWTDFDGMECNAADGWHVTGCWLLVSKTADNDVISSFDGNGCITNDWDEGNGTAMTIVCTKND
ncbi:MAG: hypothetical protein WC546_06565 [Candidatus Omnitrophota bacterium]